MIVRELRLKKGLSQEQLSQMSGVSVRTIQRIERGASPSVESLKCLAAALDIDFSDLQREQQMTISETGQRGVPGDAEREAQQYVRDVKAFYVHAIRFAVVMTGLLILNLVTSPGFLWVVFPAVGWGLGLAAHALAVFEVIDILGDKLEERQIAKRLRR